MFTGCSVDYVYNKFLRKKWDEFQVFSFLPRSSTFLTAQWLAVNFYDI